MASSTTETPRVLPRPRLRVRGRSTLPDAELPAWTRALADGDDIGFFGPGSAVWAVNGALLGGIAAADPPPVVGRCDRALRHPRDAAGRDGAEVGHDAPVLDAVEPVGHRLDEVERERPREVDRRSGDPRRM